VALVDADAGLAAGDILVHYRLQVMDQGSRRPAFSPRVSLIVPSGSREHDTGGDTGWQLNLPFSEQARDVYLHWNVGVTRMPTVSRPHIGASAIWRAAPKLHPMVEALVEGRDRVTLSPGVRIGWNRGDAQWVVGLAAPLVRDNSAATLSALGYLSYEVPFTR